MWLLFKKRALAMTCAAVCLLIALTRVVAEDVTSEVPFSLPRSRSQPFIKPIFLKTSGRIVVDVTASPSGVEITLLLRRPDGSVAGSIAGTGGNLSLTYFVTQREVDAALAAKNVKWSVEVSKPTGSDGVSGRLKLTHPK